MFDHEPDYLVPVIIVTVGLVALIYLIGRWLL